MSKRQSTSKKDPCEVINGQLETMTAQVNKFQKNNIGVAPYIAGFMSAAQDGQQAFGCAAGASKTTDPSVSSASNQTIAGSD